MPLGAMVGGFIAFADLMDAGTDLEWADDLQSPARSGHERETAAILAPSASAPMDLEEGAMACASLVLQASADEETQTCTLSHALVSVDRETQTQTCPPQVLASDVATFRVRVNNHSEGDPRATKLVSLMEVIRMYGAEEKNLPILTPTDRVVTEQRLKGAYKARADARGSKLEEM
mmetsp:Transcript_4869/g.14332  ORF Transcript_4869/g.14332 Transcript_4869/m.14332 type:complete len:176 (+) Transcript_4869:960-1487(+)